MSSTFAQAAFPLRLSSARERPNIDLLTELVLGQHAARSTLEVLDIDLMLRAESQQAVSRSVFAMALNVVLFHDLVRRVPCAQIYAGDCRNIGARIKFDHGALRTIRFASGDTGRLPPGKQAFARILEPLGYRINGVYPLDRIGMTGFAFASTTYQEDLPQFFVSELHVERFSSRFQTAAHAVFDSTIDPVGAAASEALDQFSTDDRCDVNVAVPALHELASAFGCWHDTPHWLDYQDLLAESAEAAWIATEGNVFNHATDRVADIDAVAAEQRRLGRNIKDRIEVSQSRRVRQTAFRADPVERTFIGEDGADLRRMVPGSFFEFISRDKVVGEGGRERLDVSFDSSNAQGIFRMTATG